MHCKGIENTYFDSFDIEQGPKEIEKFIGHKNIKTSIFIIQWNKSIICGYVCIGFIDFIFADKNLIDSTSLFLPYYFETNANIILSYSENGWSHFKYERPNKITIKQNQ